MGYYSRAKRDGTHEVRIGVYDNTFRTFVQSRDDDGGNGGGIDERRSKVAPGDPAEAGRGRATTGGGKETGASGGRVDTARGKRATVIMVR